MVEPQACPECLRRSWLLALLGPYLERMATGEPGSRSPELLRLSNEDLVEAAAPKVGAQLIGRVEATSERQLDEELVAGSCWACCRHGDLYPAQLRDATDAPWALIGRGDPGLIDGLEPFGAVTVVGARRATSYGREIARELGRELATAGLTVVSGLAFGIDACAHRGALDAAGRTIAVLGCGRTSPTRRPTARSGGGSANRGSSSPSSPPARRRGAGPSRPATGSWRRWRG